MHRGLAPSCLIASYQTLLNVLGTAWQVIIPFECLDTECKAITLFWIFWLLQGKLSPFLCLGTARGSITIFWMLWILFYCPVLATEVTTWEVIALFWMFWFLHGALLPSYGSCGCCMGSYLLLDAWVLNGGTVVLFWLLWVLHGALLPYSGHSVYAMGSFLPLWVFYALHQKLSPASGICDYCMKIYYPLLDVLCSAC